MDMKAYSLDLRQKLLRACDQPFGSQRPIASLCGVSQSFVEKLRRRRRTSGLGSCGAAPGANAVGPHPRPGRDMGAPSPAGDDTGA
jgi:transposase